MSTNGQLPRSELSPIWNGKLLRSDAARAFTDMDANNLRARGRHIYVDDAYRPLGHPGDLSRGLWSQWAAWERYMGGGNLAARPGTSNHGWGIAIDAGASIGDIAADHNQHGWDHSHSDAPSEPWHHRWDGHGSPPPKPSPLAPLPKHMREAAERLLYHRRQRKHEATTGKGRNWKRQDRWVSYWYRRVNKLHRKAKNENNRRILGRVLDDRDGVLT